jgi:Rrf2 family protein
MKLSQSVIYALSALLELAHHDTSHPVPCRTLAHRKNIPQRFLLQILRQLVTAGVLRSTRGADGGYCFDRPLEQISLCDVITAVERPSSSSQDLSKSFNGYIHERLLYALQTADEAEQEKLSELTLADLLKTESASAK